MTLFTRLFSCYRLIRGSELSLYLKTFVRSALSVMETDLQAGCKLLFCCCKRTLRRAAAFDTPECKTNPRCNRSSSTVAVAKIKRTEPIFFIFLRPDPNPWKPRSYPSATRCSSIAYEVELKEQLQREDSQPNGIEWICVVSNVAPLFSK